MIEKQMYLQSISVWCRFWAGSIIRPFFFENAAGQTITVNDHGYRDMIIQFFVPKLQDVNNKKVLYVIQSKIQFNLFQDRIISRFGDQNCCDLTLLNFFLWSFLKSKIYANKPTTTDAWRRKLSIISMTFSHIYAKRSWKIYKK